MDDVTALYCIDNTLYSGDDKGIVTKWYHNQVSCQYNVLEAVNWHTNNDYESISIRKL